MVDVDFSQIPGVDEQKKRVEISKHSPSWMKNEAELDHPVSFQILSIQLQNRSYEELSTLVFPVRLNRVREKERRIVQLKIVARLFKILQQWVTKGNKMFHKSERKVIFQMTYAQFSVDRALAVRLECCWCCCCCCCCRHFVDFCSLSFYVICQFFICEALWFLI